MKWQNNPLFRFGVPFLIKVFSKGSFFVKTMWSFLFQLGQKFNWELLFIFSDEKSTYNDINAIVSDSSMISSNNVPLATNTDIKREPGTPPLSSNVHHKTSLNQNLSLISQSPGSLPEASPRKKPRKQNV